MSLADNRAARDEVLDRVRKALGHSGDRDDRAEAQRYVAAHSHGPRPALTADILTHFMRRAIDMDSTIERIASLTDLPSAVARYLDSLDLPAALAAQRSRSGVCWPELADLAWIAQGLHIDARPTTGNDRLGITGTFCAIAETGTLVMLTGADSPSATALLPDTHIAVVRAGRVVAGMEEAFALIRQERGAVPRAINFISGPSRTADIEQTVVVGAHGPYRVHIVVVD